MRERNILGLALLLLLVFSLPLLAQKSKQLTAADAKEMQIKVAEDYLDAIRSLKDYLIDKSDESYEAFRSKLNSSDSLMAFLEKSNKSKLDTEDFSQLRQSIDMLKGLTIDKLKEMAGRGEKARFRIGNETAILSEDGEAPLLVILAGFKIQADKLLTELTNVFFSHMWKSSSGTFKMRACAYRSLQEEFEKIGLGEKYKVVVINMTNKLGRDVSLNPITDKFTILTTDGRQYYNCDLDFEDYSLVKGLPEEDQQSIFTKVTDIYDGADTPIIVLFPASVPSPEKWSQIIFDSAMGTLGKSLSKGSLTKEK